MNKGIKRLLIGSGVAAAGIAAAGAASYASTNFLVKVALDREQPRIKNMDKARDQLRGFQDKGDFLRELETAANKLEAQPHEVVKVAAGDGERLVGHWFPNTNPRRVIIAMHGWRSSWVNDFGLISDFWHRNGCSVLYAEQRGQNNSGGAYMGFGMIERYDCLDWIRWVRGRVGDGLPIYLAGVSMGAATVLMAAGLELPTYVHGILSDCGFTSAHAIWKHVAKNNLHLSYGVRGQIADSLCRKRIQMGSKECSTVEALKKGTTPVLFIHGSDDHFVPVEMTYENYEACVAPKKLVIVPEADHGMSYFADRSGYEKAVLDFWENFDNMGS